MDGWKFYSSNLPSQEAIFAANLYAILAAEKT